MKITVSHDPTEMVYTIGGMKTVKPTSTSLFNGRVGFRVLENAVLEIREYYDEDNVVLYKTVATFAPGRWIKMQTEEDNG